MAETEPAKLSGLSLRQLEEAYNTLHELQSFLGNTLSAIEDNSYERQALLRREIELRRVEERSDRQHSQIMRVAGWTLFWAIVGALGTIGLLLLEIPLSKLLPAKSSSQPQPRLATPPAAATPTLLPTPIATPTGTLTPSTASTPK